ncbi:ROK family protein [Tessaracoccus sp. OS52]|uniref:ROK family protein n=1 Tax=Tessaracoccus sp. OS52 TaxID=2886691 RepID=UPI001D0FD3A6|nr:ROK family protein [Tessaracoccus sp. OS52]MCC2593694.1 ROK family protein [Tessaracoccus sp. OS52]
MQSVAPQIARRINDRVALDLMLSSGLMTRSGMRAALGMSQPSTLELFERLLADGLIEEAGVVAGRRGPRANGYRVNVRKALVAVARVAPDECVAAIADLGGELLSVVSGGKPTDTHSPSQHVAQTIRNAVQAAQVDADSVKLTVVATRGVVDPGTGDVAYVKGHPEWKDAIRSNMEQELEMPVHLENQVKLLGLAELEAVRPSTPDNFVLISIGPAGIASAIVLDGELWRGTNGAAGEIAYLPTGPELPALGPGNQVSGGLGNVIGRLRTGRSADFEALTLPVTLAVGAICSVVDPQMVVLGGPWGQAGGKKLAESVEASLASLWPMTVPIQTTRVTGDAVLKGAARAGLDRLLPDLWGPRTRLTRE